LQDLFALGEYKMSSYSSNNNEIEFWNIFLVTEKPYEEIENALMFVMDFCKITKIANFNIFDFTSLESRNEEFQYPVDRFEANSEDLLETAPSLGTNSKIQTLNENITTLNGGQERIVSTRINVEIAKLDSLMYLVSELVTSKSELLIGIQKHDTRKLLDAAEKIDKLSKLFSDNALDIRLVSLSEMLSRFKRLIRDLAKQLGKNIDFVIKGEDTELDKTIIDALGEPIMHLIRNNIDHGIELSEIRVAKGKPANGIIRFEAEKTGNGVLISISDDGKGIDLSFVYNKAVEKGFITAGTQLSEQEILNLIFLPGFSTAQSLTEVSGRGVGMDIVQKKIKEIRGEISVSSEAGKGTTFTIKLQQTISIIDTLLIKAEKTIYAIPVEDIEACLLETHNNIASRQNNLIVYGDQLIPFVSLKGSLTGVSAGKLNEKLIIIKKQNRRYAIITDSILGEYQAVIKPLGSTFSEVQFLSGVSLLGDGSIALLLDTDKLWSEISMNSEERSKKYNVA
jgi:two-component system chemotaxis sensor kinase CheA